LMRPSSRSSISWKSVLVRPSVERRPVTQQATSISAMARRVGSTLSSLGGGLCEVRKDVR